MQGFKAVQVTLGLIVLFGAGCTSQKIISMQSIPTEAEVYASANSKGPTDFLLGETPLQYTFLFGSSPENGPTLYNLDFKKAGYETKTVTLDSRFAGDTIKVQLEREVVKEIGKYVLVVSEDQGYTLELRMVRAWVEDIEREGMAASSIVRLSENQSVLGMALSPDGDTLYFSLAEPIQDEKGQEKVMANLRSIKSSGGGVTQITSGQWLDANPTCGEEGQFLLFNSNRIQSDKPDLFRISTEKTGGIAVIRQTSEGANYQPNMVAELIAFTYKPKYQGRFSSTPQIWTLGGEAGYPTQLRNGSMPAVSPNAKEIAFIGEDGQLWKMPTTGLNPVQLTSEAINLEGKRNPVWSPDGNYILFASDVGKDNRDKPNYDIWIIPSDGGMGRQLTTNGSEDDCPAVSPDQKHIYFVSNRGFKEGIWRIPFPTSKSGKSKDSDK